MRSSDLLTNPQLRESLWRAVGTMGRAGLAAVGHGQFLAGMSSFTVLLATVFAVVMAIALDTAQIVGGRRAVRRTRARLEQGFVVILCVGWLAAVGLTRLLR
jgi:hypothetical protein